MDAEKAAEELKTIRQLMERPIRYSTMSGLSGIVAGLAALAGLTASGCIWWQCPGEGLGRAGLWEDWPHPETTTLLATAAVWAGVFVVALAGTILLTWRREKSMGLPFWTPVKRRILLTILPPFLAGAGLTGGVGLRLLSDPTSDLWMLVAPAWMLFYGLALWQAGEFSVGAVRKMGAAFMAAGLLVAVTPPLLFFPELTLGVTFGVVHIVYGIYVWICYGG